ncbi:MAG: M48 family metalloprotease [Clostridia bacterium]|nr:M48 family metalloprotease [Clostridia bacterium]
MSEEKIGGLSLDDIMASAMDGLDDGDTDNGEINAVDGGIVMKKCSFCGMETTLNSTQEICPKCNHYLDGRDITTESDSGANASAESVSSSGVPDIESSDKSIGGIPLAEIMDAADLDAPTKSTVIVKKQNAEKTADETMVVSEKDNSEESGKTVDNIVKIKDEKQPGTGIIKKDDTQDLVDTENLTEDLEKAQKRQETIDKLRKFYVFDFFYRTAKAKNWGLFVWLFLNFTFIEVFFCMGGWIGALLGPVVYSVSLVVALSPLGEFLLRQQNACREIKDKDIKSKIQPIFDKVYAEAREKNPNISPNVKLFMCDEESENAFATGRRTVCITKGLANMDADHIAGVLAHEFGHLAHRDTDNLLIVVVGNLIVTVITSIIGIIFNIFGVIGDFLTSQTTLGRIIPFSIITRFLVFIFVNVFMFLWTKLGTLLCMRGNRKEEFAADNYAAQLGYAQNLADALDALEDAPAPKGLWAALTSTHPQTADRVMKLNEYIEQHQYNALS